MIAWAKENAEIVVVAALTVAGFFLQYWHFENKISSRDQRDLFMRKTEEPVAQLLRDYSNLMSELQVWKRRKTDGQPEEIFSRLVKVNRAFNMMIVGLNASKFDLGDGWASFDTDRIDSSLEEFDADPSDLTCTGLIAAIDRLSGDLQTHLGRCRHKFAPDT